MNEIGFPELPELALKAFCKSSLLEQFNASEKKIVRILEHT